MYKIRLIALVAVLWQTGCSLLPDDRAMNYLQAEEQPATRTPVGMTLATSQAYPIPVLPQQPEKPTQFEVPRPAPYVPESGGETVSSLSEYQNTGLNPRLEHDGAGTLILRLDGSFAADWAAVTEALSRSELKLSDLNRSTGTYYLAMKTRVPEEELGWWDRMWGNEEVITTTYLLKMNRARNGVYLSLLTDADTLAEEDLTKQILNEIKRQLDK